MMEDKNFEELKQLAKLINSMEKRSIEESSELVDNIIEYKNHDEKVISRTFDKMLSIAFATAEDIKDIYYKLLNYTKGFNEELSKDYEEIFIEHFKDIDEEDYNE